MFDMSLQSGEKITAIYVRLSKEDEQDGESNSIANQKAFLVDYAKMNGFENIKVFADDGISGLTLNRSEFNRMYELIESGMVENLIVKDMSRLGRNYLEVGRLTEYVLPSHSIRFVSVNDGVDTAKGKNEFTPFRNIMNEWYSKDISRKIKCSQRLISKQGFAVGQPPYGYKRSFENLRIWIIDEEAAEIVRLIYKMRLEGKSFNKIAEFLQNKKILIPSQYALEKGIKRPQKIARNRFFWNPETIRKILRNQSYTGDIVNFKTYRKSLKLRKLFENPKENWEIHKNIHEAIIERSVWEDVQKTIGIKQRKPKSTEKNMFVGFLKCADCGANINYVIQTKSPQNHHFSCGNFRRKNGLCDKSHHVRIDELTGLVRNYINEILVFTKDFEDEFVQLITGENQKQSQTVKKKNQETLQRLKDRYNVLDILFKKIFEDKIFGRLNEERFLKLSSGYESEQSSLKEQIKNLEQIVSKEVSQEESVYGFLKIVNKNSKVEELTREVLNEFIDKILVWHSKKIDGIKNQKIEIHYKLIGQVSLWQETKDKLLVAK
ncbi:MAG: recombinase family protein [Oscillospiraceae bacterium]|jgi:DNA invertase Pin-like site-specific DNA recombinase|nr:recombinase family protein [Oscillospiraceae bacterium]